MMVMSIATVLQVDVAYAYTNPNRQREGVPCSQLDGQFPGGVAVRRRGNRCFLSDVSGAAKRLGRPLDDVVSNRVLPVLVQIYA